MIRGSGPVWTAAPSRFADWSRGSALLALAALLFALLASFGAAGDDPAAAADAAAYAGAIEAMRHGGDFYPALSSSLRASGDPAGVLAFAPPTLAAISSRLPGFLTSALLLALAGAVFAAWWPTLRAAFARPAGRWAAGALLAAALVAYVWLVPVTPAALSADRAIYLRPAMLDVPEAWAGLFAALSLGLWARGGWLEAAAFGLAAGVVREVAGVYLAVMLLFALLSGSRREALAWGAAAAVLAVVAAAHWRAVAGEFGPIAPGDPWTSDGIALALRAMADATPLGLLPATLGAPLVVLALFGWLAWNAPAAARGAATLTAGAALVAVVPGAEPGWGRATAAVLLVGLAFVPDGLRNLARAAVGQRRRITVTRVVR